MAVRFTSHKDTILRRMRGNIKSAASDIATIAVEAVQEKILWGYSELHGKPPHKEIVDTGALFDSIEAQVKQINASYFQTTVGTDIPYAKYVHEGYTQPAGLRFKGKDGNWYTTKGGKINGRPFIKDGLDAASADLEKAIKEAIKNGF